MSIAIALVLGYLLGSIPFGLIVTRLAGTGDIRAIGSGNIGATNVLRTGRKGLAAATLLGDMLKGTVAVLIAALAVGARSVARRSARRGAGSRVSGLARLQGRQGCRDLYRRAAGARLARRRRVCRGVGLGGRGTALFVARRSGRQRPHARHFCCGGRGDSRWRCCFSR